MSGKRKRTIAKKRAKVMGIMAAVILFGGLSVPAAGAAEVYVSGTGVAYGSASPEVGTSSPLSTDSVKVTQKEAEESLLKLFPKLSQAAADSVRLTDEGYGESGRPMWEVMYSYRTGNSSSGFSARVDAMTGDLIQVYLPYEMTRGSAAYPPKIKRGQALEIAKSFIMKAVPSLKGQSLKEDAAYRNPQMELTPLFGPVAYSFNFITSVNGVRVEGQSLNITVDGNGEVTQFYSYGGSPDFPSAVPKVTAAEARKRLETDLNVQLVYTAQTAQTSYGKEPAPEDWRLIYSPWLPSSLLDAQTGQWVDYAGLPVSMSLPKYAELPKPLHPFSAKAVTAEEAAANAAAYVDIPDGYALVSRSLQQGRGGGHEFWSLRWQNEKSSPYGGRSAEVDAVTGQLLAYRVDFYGPGFPSTQSPARDPLPPEQAAKLADDWVSANVPDAASYRRLIQADVPPGSSGSKTEYTGFSYQRFYNDLPVQGQTINLTLDGKGKLNEYYGQTAIGAESLKKLDSLKASVTEEQARSLFLKAAAMELLYSRSGGFYVMPSGEYVKPTVRLAYRVTGAENGQLFYDVVDAATGKWINLYGIGSPSAPAGTPADVKGHWSEASLAALLEHGVIQPGEDGLVHPDRSVKLGDFMQMLALASDPRFGSYSYYDPNGRPSKPFADIDSSSPYYGAVNWMIDRKWLVPDANAKLNPDAVLTRDRLAEFLATMSGYEKLAAKLTDLPAFTRLTDAAKVPHPGAAALALKLGLLTPQDGSFRPNDKVTLAQLAVVFVRLAERQNEWDRPLTQ